MTLPLLPLRLLRLLLVGHCLLPCLCRLIGLCLRSCLCLATNLACLHAALVFINNDMDMYHAESDTPAQAQTSALNEELGQVGLSSRLD